MVADGFFDFYINEEAGPDALPVDQDDARVIRSVYQYLDSVTGLRFRETLNKQEADVVFMQTRRSAFGRRTLGETSLIYNGSREQAKVTYANASFDEITLAHEIGHTVGLDHPGGNGYNRRFNRDDTIMSYMPGSQTLINFREADIKALEMLWGKAGSNYDAWMG